MELDVPSRDGMACELASPVLNPARAIRKTRHRLTRRLDAISRALGEASVCFDWLEAHVDPSMLTWQFAVSALTAVFTSEI